MITATAKLKPIGKPRSVNSFEVEVELVSRNPRLWRIKSGTLGGEVIEEDELEFTTEPKENGRYPCSSCGRLYLLKHAVSHCDEHPGQLGTDD